MTGTGHVNTVCGIGEFGCTYRYSQWVLPPDQERQERVKLDFTRATRQPALLL